MSPATAAAPVYLRGIDMPLPPGERVLWQGSPDGAALARYAFHSREIAAYFAALLVIAAIVSVGDPTPTFFLTATVCLVGSAIAAIAFMSLLGRLTARTTLYAITERRVVMKIGIALSVVLNIPLHAIDSVDIRRRGTRGDLALRLGGKDRLAYAVLWPHARPWRLRSPEPMLRCLNDARVAADILCAALRAQSDAAAPAAVASPAAAVASGVAVAVDIAPTHAECAA